MTTSERRTAATVAALVVPVVVMSAAFTPFVLVAGGIWALVWFCRRYARRSAGQPGAGTGLRYHLSAFGVLYLVPIGIAATFYCLLAAYLRLFADSVGIGRLVALQRRFEAVSGFFSDHVKISELEVFGVLIAVHLLTCLLLTRRGRRAAAGTGHGWRWRVASSLHRGTEFYTRFSGPVAAGLATLAAFTVFGMHLGEPAADLRLRLKVAQQGYAELTRQVEADLNRQVAAGLYDKVYTALPPPYRDMLANEATVGDLLDGLRTHAEQARTTYGVKVASVDKTVTEEASRRARIVTLPAELRLPAEGRTDLPEGVTPQRVAAARAATGGSEAPGVEAPGVDLVTDGRRNVTLQIEKVVSERIIALAKPLTDAVPIIEPLLQAFAEAADKALQERLGLAYDRLVGGALAGQRDLDAAVTREARVIVERTDVTRAVHRATPDAERVAETRRLLMSSLRGGSALIDRTVAETLAARQPPRVRPVPPLAKLPPLELPPSLRYDNYGLPDLRSYRPPPDTYRPPPRMPPVRPVRPPVRIPFW